MAFWVGQKVMCVDGKPDPRSWWTNAIVREGDIYTIRGFAPYCSILRDQPVLLVEVEANDPRAGFIPSRFRPLVEKSTDTGMAILREILDRESVADKPPAKIRVDD